MSNPAEPTIQFCTFQNKNDNVPKPWKIPWTKLAKVLTTHRVRQDKDGPLWSPTLYKNGSRRGNDGVEAITAAVGDFDTGLTYEEALPNIARYEHVAHSTHSHTPEHPKFRVVIPLSTHSLKYGSVLFLHLSKISATIPSEEDELVCREKART